MEHKCRYCGAPATRWSGVDIYHYDFKLNSLKCVGPGYCCDSCDKDGNWIPIGEKRKPEKFIKPKRRRSQSSDMIFRVQQASLNSNQGSRTWDEGGSGEPEI